MKRIPAVAGQFYSGTEKPLRAELYEFVEKDTEKVKAIGVVSPHAGYVYSGAVAGKVFSSVVIPPVAVILGPNHSGAGKPFSIMTEGSWMTPLGDAPIDDVLAKDLLSRSRLLEEDDIAHAKEHSLEVQVPFLQYRRPDIRIVPICIGGRGADQYVMLGREIAAVLKARRDGVLIVASSDMSHYEHHEEARRKDGLAIDAILALDEEGMLSRVREHDISMCGYAPVAAMLAAAKELGATRADLVLYRTSGDASGDYRAVVGYAGIRVY